MRRLRLARYFSGSAEFWLLGIQARYDLEVARRALRDEIDAIEPRELA